MPEHEPEEWTRGTEVEVQNGRPNMDLGDGVSGPESRWRENDNSMKK